MIFFCILENIWAVNKWTFYLNRSEQPQYRKKIWFYWCLWTHYCIGKK